MTTENKQMTVRNGADAQVAAQEPLERFAAPLADIYETRDAYVLMLDMPGASKETINVRLERGNLEVKGVVQRTNREGANVLHAEHATPGYYRAFALGEGIDLDSIDAQYENGVLTVKLLKGEKVKAREISIR